MSKLFLTITMGTLVLGAMCWAPPDLIAQASDPPPLSGVVSSQQEGLMEGVVVSARRDGANFTVSVVSDAHGKYSFPRTHLQPGNYALTIRAVGYDLKGPASADVSESKSAIADLKLDKTKDLAAQLSSLEWAMSIPGTPEQKDKVHLSNRELRLLPHLAAHREVESHARGIRRPDHAHAEVLHRRLGRQHRQPRPRTARPSRSGCRRRARTRSGAASLSGSRRRNWPNILPRSTSAAAETTWPYELKTLPRPKGKATRVIITQYDMPRPDTVAHDLDLDSKGTIWYTDESRMFFGKMDPKTGAFTEYVAAARPARRLAGREGHSSGPRRQPLVPAANRRTPRSC